MKSQACEDQTFQDHTNHTTLLSQKTYIRIEEVITKSRPKIKEKAFSSIIITHIGDEHC